MLVGSGDSMNVEGLEQLFRRLNTVKAQKVLRAPMNRAALRIQADMQRYPAQRPNSSYRRTGTLGRSWTSTIDNLGDGIRVRIGNRVRYAPFVQSSMFQARVHRRRWQTDRIVLNRHRGAIQADFARTVNQALGGKQ